MKYAILSAFLLLLSFRSHAQSGKFVHIKMVGMTFSGRLLTEGENVGPINKKEFEKRFRNQEGTERVLVYMDSLGYDPIHMEKTSISDFDMIFKKR